MENYTKAHVAERPTVSPFVKMAPEAPEVRCKDGSKLRNLLRFALSRLEAKPREKTTQKEAVEEEEEEEKKKKEKMEETQKPLCRQIVFTASGKGVSKAITCAEIVKRRVKRLHQITRLDFTVVDETWNPLEPEAGLDSLTVSRNVPCVWILLSRDPLDPRLPGYQAPGRYDDLWLGAGSNIKDAAAAANEERVAGFKRKKSGRGSGRHVGKTRESSNKGMS